MKAVLQKVRSARVRVDREIVGAIERGWLIYLGVGSDDHSADADWLIRRILALRMFRGADGDDVSVLEVGGNLLVVSQFTLFANCRKGGKPSWHRAAEPTKGEALYQYFLEGLRAREGLTLAAGKFGAMMEVESINDGPVTLLLDSRSKSGK
ncbi:MAG: D-tyrosyl-tRNA(Tyr) deacylase [Opitutales bacterium]|nr:D-tyrosyl-tRNA(Tyr) deacylase [Opitutales bacterium]MCH8540267.1 D-tyrosyl-tRNA(Tyr) deacylase [Opitutales bacterium]